MAGPAEIQVIGAKELRRDLKKVGADTAWRPALKSVYSRVGTHVEGAVKGASMGSRMGGAARNTYKGKGTTTNASITGGGSLPYFHGFEFGSHRYKQFPPVRQGGYYLYPTIASERERIEGMFFDGVVEVLDGANL